MQAELKTGPIVAADGAQTVVRGDKQGALVATDAHGRYHEAAYRGNVYSINAGFMTQAAGQLTGAAAAASTNFAVWNPANSGKIMSLLFFHFGLHSGTPAAGPLLYGYLPNHAITLASSGTPTNNYIGQAAGSVARYLTSGAGSALTGGTAPVTFRIANFDLTAVATAGTTVLGQQPTMEPLEGSIIIGPGQGFIPQFGAAGTTVIFSCGVTWEELPL